jgi:hypothetical protein
MKAAPFVIAVLSGTLQLVSQLGANAQNADPSPTPSARPGTISLSVQAHATFISEGTRGAGTTPPEGPGFASGSPLSPLTPYDTFSSAPLAPGNALESALFVTPTYFGKNLQAAVTLGAGYVRGSTTAASYWGESLFQTLNPHLGSQMLPYRIVFPTHAGSDDGTGFAASVVSASVGSRDGSFSLRGGWFDLAQSDGFVFTQPALTSVPPAIAFATAESLGNGTPTLDWWGTSSGILPLHGIDAVVRRGLATIELTSAALPSLPGTGARLNMGSFVIDHGEGTRYSLQALHVATGGALVATTVLYGGDPMRLSTPQGMLPTSTIGGQRQTILGARAAFHLIPTLDVVAEYGRSTYDADHVAVPGTSKPGNYYHGAINRTVRRLALGLDFYRNEAYYAQALLPYGVAENVWSVAWSWPGQWLKSNYQLINDFPVNINRQGYRFRYALTGRTLELKGIYANFGQIEPISLSNAYRTGFIDGFFLPQADVAATLGRQHQYAFWGAWHPSFGDLTVDYAEDTMRRPALAAYPQDAVSYDAPSYVLTFSRRLGPNVLASVGYGRYAMRGSFSQAFTNVDFAQRVGILGAQIQQTKNTAALVSIRWSGLTGLPSIPFSGPSPAFSGTVFILEQKLKVH